MSSAPSKTGCFDSFATNPQDKTEPATSLQSAPSGATEVTVHPADEARHAGSGALTAGSNGHQPTNLPLGVSDLTLGFKDGTPIKGNRIPFRKETPILFTVRITNKPKGVDCMDMNVVISEVGKSGNKRGRSGRFTKYDTSATYKKTVPIVTDGRGHSITIEIAHATGHSHGWHTGDGPYDAHLSFTPVVPGVESIVADAREAAEHDDEDESGVSQVEETLRYTFYNPQTHFLARLYYAVWRFWDAL